MGTVVASGVKHALSSAVILPATHQGADRVNDPTEPLPTVTAANRGELMMASPLMVGAGGPSFSGKPVPADQPVGTLMTQNHRALVTAFIEQANGGFNTTPAKGADEPMSTVTNTGSQQRLATASLATLRRNCIGRAIDEPVPTMTASAEHHALLEYTLSPEHEAGALRVAAFLVSYYGTENTSAADQPAPTITTKDRLALVTVFVKGTPYVIVDICLRMLQPHELYRAQGFPASYIIDKGADGKPFTKTEQVHMCGNSVSPPPMAALALANDPWQAARQHTQAA